MQNARQFSSDTLMGPNRTSEVAPKASFADYHELMTRQLQDKKGAFLTSEQAQSLSIENHKATAFFPDDLNENQIPLMNKTESLLEEEKVARVISVEGYLDPEEQKSKIQKNLFNMKVFGDSQSEYQGSLNPMTSKKKNQFLVNTHNSCKEEESSQYFHSSTGARKKNSGVFHHLKKDHNDVKRFHSLI
mmetsp:Transcript_9910/g.9769  ORF Transcript_9910/g.9769 Transcript_9910/m.9769 type:complete len:189 (+) Transcript_9910:413-979(+)